MNDTNKPDHPLPAPLEPAKVTPSKTDPLSPPPGVSVAFGPDGTVTVKPLEQAKKADDKKKLPRGSSAFRHA